MTPTFARTKTILDIYHESDNWRPGVAGWTNLTQPQISAWAIGVAYKVGDLVTYNGSTYRCLQAHTSISTWTPTAAVSLWQKQ